METCKRCGKPLTSKLSVKKGYGPICWRIVKNEKKLAQSSSHSKRFVNANQTTA